MLYFNCCTVLGSRVQRGCCVQMRLFYSPTVCLIRSWISHFPYRYALWRMYSHDTFNNQQYNNQQYSTKEDVTQIKCVAFVAILIITIPYFIQLYRKYSILFKISLSLLRVSRMLICLGVSVERDVKKSRCQCVSDSRPNVQNLATSLTQYSLEVQN